MRTASISSSLFNGAGAIEGSLPVDDGDAAPGEGVDAAKSQPVDADARIVGTVLAHEIGDLVRPDLDCRATVVACRAVAVGHEAPGAGGANLRGRRQPAEEIDGVVPLEQHRRPVGQHHDIAAVVVERVDLHVARVGNVTDVDGVVSENGR